MVSVIICSLLTHDDTSEKRELIQNCVSSLHGYDELIILTTVQGGLGYCSSWNTAAKMARGDYLIFISDDHVALDPLGGMCVENTVTSPKGTGTGQGDFWGGMFCVPRNIYEKYGLYDMAYDKGVHYMDEDLYERYKKEGVNMSRVNVKVLHNDPGHTLKHVSDLGGKISINAEIFQKRWRQ